METSDFEKEGEGANDYSPVLWKVRKAGFIGITVIVIIGTLLILLERKLH